MSARCDRNRILSLTDTSCWSEDRVGNGWTTERKAGPDDRYKDHRPLCQYPRQGTALSLLPWRKGETRFGWYPVLAMKLQRPRPIGETTVGAAEPLQRAAIVGLEMDCTA